MIEKIFYVAMNEARKVGTTNYRLHNWLLISFSSRKFVYLQQLAEYWSQQSPGTQAKRSLNTDPESI